MGIPPLSPHYRLYGNRLRADSAIMAAILDSWCDINCSGDWDIQKGGGWINFGLRLEDDLMLFLLSSEYAYIGNPVVVKYPITA